MNKAAMHREFAPSLSRSADFGTYFSSPFLADYTVELVCSGGTGSGVRGTQQTRALPAHALILSRASPFLKELIEIDLEGKGEGDERGQLDASSHRSSPHACSGRLKLPVPSIEGGLLTLEAMYSPSVLGIQSSPELLVSVLRIADQLQADTVMLAAAKALLHAGGSSTSGPRSRNSGEEHWPWSVVAQVLDLPPSLLSTSFCRPLLLRAHQRLIACYADLEAAWAEPEMRGHFLQLPTDALEYLLSHPDLQAASENTCFVAVTDYVERGRGKHATPQQLVQFASLLRLQHLSPSFFVSYAINRPWLLRAASYQEHMGGHTLFNNPHFAGSTPPPTAPSPSPTASTPNRMGEHVRSSTVGPALPPAGDISSSSSNNSNVSPSDLHPIIADSMGSYSSSDSDTPSEGLVEADAALVLPFPPLQALQQRSSSASRSTRPARQAHPSGPGQSRVLPSTLSGPGLSTPSSSAGSLSMPSGPGLSVPSSSTGGFTGVEEQLMGKMRLCTANRRGVDGGESLEDELRGALKLCTQYASFASGQAHVARTAGALDWTGFMSSSSVQQPPRELPVSSFSSLLDPNNRKWDTRAAGTGMLQLEVPLHRLRSELEALGWVAPQQGSSFLNRLASELASTRPGSTTAATAAGAGAAPGGSSNPTQDREGSHPDTATPPSCTSSANLVPSPTIVWAGYVWSMDVFVARDPEYVLGLSVHALYPAFALPLPPTSNALPDDEGGFRPSGETFSPPQISSISPDRHKEKSVHAVSAQMFLSVFDVELGRWIALYPKAISTNTGLEQYSSRQRNPACTSSSSFSSAENAAPGAPRSPPAQHPYYNVTYTDYYPVWTSSSLSTIVSDPASWQRSAYAPEGRILLRAELVQCR